MIRNGNEAVVSLFLIKLKLIRSQILLRIEGHLYQSFHVLLNKGDTDVDFYLLHPPGWHYVKQRMYSIQKKRLGKVNIPLAV